MRTKAEQIALIEETVAYYGEDMTRRGVEPGGLCVYEIGGNKCAVGRCMTDQSIREYGNFQGGFIDLKEYLEEHHFKGIDAILKEEYRGFSDIFWINLQSLHDTTGFWARDHKGLSDTGEKFVGAMILNIEQGAVWEMDVQEHI